MERSIIIIGAGMAGLSTGCYGQMNSYKTRIFESHNIPGGLCTSWKRKGYLMDGCIHWLTGSRTGPFYEFYKELGAVQDRRFYNSEEFTRIEGGEGKPLIFYTDVDRLERHMMELAPVDGSVIKEFCNAIRILSGGKPPIQKPMELMGLFDALKMLKIFSYIKTLDRYNKISIQDFAARFKDPFMRKWFPFAMEELSNLTMTSLLITLADMHNKNAGMPVGGSLKFAQAVNKRYRELGGEIVFNVRVAKILVENNRAVGVRLEDGSEHRADIVVSAADGHTTIYSMLEGKYLNDKISNYYNNWPIYEGYMQITLGVDRDFSGEPHKIFYIFEEPVKVGNQTRGWVTLQHYCHDPSMARPGKSVVTACFMMLDFEYWQKLYQDPEAYKAEKKAVADAVIDQIEKRFPGTRDKVEVVDVATPMTYARYTGNRRGSYMGWLETPRIAGKYMKRSLPGLDDFYMAGHWVYMGGGIAGSVMSGRNLMQIICKRDKQKFETSIP